MKDATRDVAEFFGNIADTYGEKYERADAFHHYFFNERLDEAVGGRDFSGSRVLDVGAGTGRLYDRIAAEHPSVDYYAVDISEGMLASSMIPPDRQFIGTIDDVSLPVDEFDFIFLLGVTTYISDQDLARTLEVVHALLSSKGTAIVTFTNRTSADWMMRRFIRKMPGVRRSKRSVISQNFPTYARSMKEIEGLVGERFTIERTVGLNHTVFPFNQLLKRPSVRLARSVHPKAETGTKRILSSDILVELRKL